MQLINETGFVTEAAFHHSDLAISWAEVHVKLMPHSAKGITDKGFDLAEKIEATATWFPKKWVR